MKSEKTLADRLIRSGKTLAVAESCTGGLIGHTLTNIPGASAWFTGGVIVYADQAKIGMLGVPAAVINNHGAVSARTAEAMARGARQRFHSDLAMATTGIAGPAGGTPGKPVGLVFIALASARGTIVKKYLFKGSRLSIKKQTLNAALSMLLSIKHD